MTRPCYYCSQPLSLPNPDCPKSYLHKQAETVECEGSRSFYGEGGDGWATCRHCGKRVVVNERGRAPHQRLANPHPSMGERFAADDWWEGLTHAQRVAFHARAKAVSVGDQQ